MELDRSPAGRVAVVTGAASGIGRATADLLAAEGALVARLDKTTGCDVSDAASVERAIEAARRERGPIDIVVNAAGIAVGGLPDDESFLDQWNLGLAVNLTGTMLVVRACLPDLLRQPGGRIVNIASTEGIGAGRGTMPYSVSKHGVVGFTRSLAVHYGRQGLTANAICPGATLTGMTAPIPEADRDRFAARNVPIGRYGHPEEIAHVIVSLVVPAASFVNGAVIPVDGGQTARTQ
jgi:3-oxoacyl-[acyl-carrier protein] reductase